MPHGDSDGGPTHEMMQTAHRSQRMAMGRARLTGSRSGSAASGAPSGVFSHESDAQCSSPNWKTLTAAP
jgi:hypothetical protein